MLKKVLLLALVLPVLSSSAVSARTTATPSDGTMQLSSWQSEVVGDRIVGGVQAVTIHSTAPSSIRTVVFVLEEPPCECSVSSVSANTGTLEAGVWTIDDLAPGSVATLELTYVGR
jgi:hypothetical protein